MYCVKCGVKLTDGAESCPLCGTPVWNPASGPERELYPCNYPEQLFNERIPALAFITVVLCAICLSCLIACLKTFGSVAWSGYVMLGIAAVYVMAFLPMWFRHPHPLIFVPVGFAAACVYLLYINEIAGGHWFLSFAFPAVMLVCVLTTGTIALYRYVKKGKLIITGGLLIAIGGASMLLELFQHITFGTEMFTWSLYSVSAFGVFGAFLILAGLIPHWRDYLERKFFL